MFIGSFSLPYLTQIQVHITGVSKRTMIQNSVCYLVHAGNTKKNKH